MRIYFILLLVYLNDVRKHCDRRLVFSFTTEGNVYEFGADNFESKICKDETNYSCCTRKDYYHLEKFWNDRISRVIYSYYISYEKMVRFIFGFSNEINSIARFLNNNKNSVLKNLKYNGFLIKKNKIYVNTSLKILKLELNKDKVRQIMSKIHEYFSYLGGIRKGLICMICKQKDEYIRYIDPLINKDIIYGEFILSENFCIDLVKNTFHYASFIRYYLATYLQHLLTIFNCFEFEVDTKWFLYKLKYVNNEKFFGIKESKKFINKLIDILDDDYMNVIKYSSCEKDYKIIFLKRCQLYCEEFRLGKASKDFEGNLENLKKIYNVFLAYKHVFKNQYKNFLTLELTDWQYLIEYYYKYSSKYFFLTQDKYLKIYNFVTYIKPVGYDLHKNRSNDSLYFFFNFYKIIFLYQIYIIILI